MRKKISIEDVNSAIQELVKMGLVEDSGKRRNENVVWTLTKKGRNVACLLKEFPEAQKQ